MDAARPRRTLRSGRKGCPPPRQPDKPGFESAVQLIKDVKTRLPNQYTQFMRLLQDYKQAGVPVTNVAVRVASMFDADPDLIERFRLFLPESEQAQFATACDEAAITGERTCLEVAADQLQRATEEGRVVDLSDDDDDAVTTLVFTLDAAREPLRAFLCASGPDKVTARQAGDHIEEVLGVSLTARNMQELGALTLEIRRLLKAERNSKPKPADGSDHRAKRPRPSDATTDAGRKRAAPMQVGSTSDVDSWDREAEFVNPHEAVARQLTKCKAQTLQRVCADLGLPPQSTARTVAEVLCYGDHDPPHQRCGTVSRPTRMRR